MLAINWTSVACTLLLVLCAGCALDHQRRQDYVTANPHLESAIRQAILEGKLALGMTEAEVEASVGLPTKTVTAADTTHGEMEVWVYDHSYESTSMFDTHRASGDTHVTKRVVVLGWRVFFKDGKVVRYEEF